MTIAIDVDSVLFPINELVVLPLLEARLGRAVSKQEITTWSYGEIEGGKDIAYEAFRRSTLYDPYDLSVTPGATEALAELRSTYDRVIAVSSPFAGHATSKWRYLQRCGFDHEDIVLCGDKSLVDFSVLVDDKPETCAELGTICSVVFDQPWNRLPELAEHERAYSWEDVPRKVARLIL